MKTFTQGIVSRLGIVAGLALAPKCTLCGLAYAGLFGLGTELCGEPTASWPTLLPIAAGALGAGGFLCRRAGLGRYFASFLPAKVPSP